MPMVAKLKDEMRQAVAFRERRRRSFTHVVLRWWCARRLQLYVIPYRTKITTR